MVAKPNNPKARRKRQRKTQLKRLERIFRSKGKLFSSLRDRHDIFYNEVDIAETLEHAMDSRKVHKMVKTPSKSKSPPDIEALEVTEHKMPVLPLNESELNSVMRLLRVALIEQMPEMFELVAREMRRSGNDRSARELDAPLRALLLAADNGPVHVKLLARELLSHRDSKIEKHFTGKPTKAETARLRAYERQLERYCTRFTIPQTKKKLAPTTL